VFRKAGELLAASKRFTYDAHAINDQVLDSGQKVQFARNIKVTGMVDIFNALNANPATTVRLTTVNFHEVTAILDPRIVRFGFRFDF